MGAEQSYEVTCGLGDQGDIPTDTVSRKPAVPTLELLSTELRADDEHYVATVQFIPPPDSYEQGKLDGFHGSGNARDNPDPRLHWIGARQGVAKIVLGPSLRPEQGTDIDDMRRRTRAAVLARVSGLEDLWLRMQAAKSTQTPL